MRTIDPSGPLNPGSVAPCWFCGQPAAAICRCTRSYCIDHAFRGYCLICALGEGLFEGALEGESLSGLIMLSLSALSGDPYIVIPPALVSWRPIPLVNVERLVGALIKMLSSEDADLREHAATVLATTTNSWPTLDPSAVNKNKYGASLMATDQVRRWLLHVLKQARSRVYEGVALTILDKLRTADFRDLYPNIQDNLKSLSCSNTVSRVCGTFEALLDFYPSYSHLANEQCELLVYEQYANRGRGAGATMERVYGPLLKNEPVLGRMLKRGTWLSNHARYNEWYYGEEAPV